jgi:hypothetical protein
MGASMRDWFVRQFTILGGIPVQNWMLMAFAIILVGIALSWWSQR